jgi:hypothetical protein
MVSSNIARVIGYIEQLQPFPRLLRLGANVGLRNLAGEAPIAGVLPATMEEFLNTACLQVLGT